MSESEKLKYITETIYGELTKHFEESRLDAGFALFVIDAIRARILEKGWNDSLNKLVQDELQPSAKPEVTEHTGTVQDLKESLQGCGFDAES